MKSLREKFRMRRTVRPYDRERFAPNALAEGFVRQSKGGSYKLPRVVRRFLRRPLSAYAGRPRMMIAVQALCEVIGQYHTGGRNFVTRGMGLGPDGGFFLNRAGLARSHDELTEALVREAIAFLTTIGFIHRLTPRGELVEVRRPKNATGPLGYFRTCLKAKKDSLGRIRSPMVLYRLGDRVLRLFAKTLRPDRVENVWLVQEPLWSRSLEILSLTADPTVEGIHTGSCEFDRAGHDPNDPRFLYRRPDPMRDPRSKPRFSEAQVDEADAILEAMRRNPPKLNIRPGL